MIIRKPPEVNFAKDKIVCLTAGGSRDEVLAEYVQRRLDALKCPARIRPYLASEFLIARPHLRNPMTKTAPFAAAAGKIKAALRLKKKIVLFGDYDCDGITSIALLHDYLRAAGLPANKCATFIPLRHVHGYGLTMAALKRCVKIHRPEFLIVLDCGTNRHVEIDWLNAQGIDSVIVDHHLPAEGEQPDAPLINPKAWSELPDDCWDLKLASAAGLSFLLVQGMADGLKTWDEERAILLAGLGTYVDMVPLVGINRLLVQHSLHHARTGGLKKVPGLLKLEQFRQSNKFTVGPLTEQTYGLFIGPCLNAPGRLGDAKDALHLLLAENPPAVKRLAKKCFFLNERRKSIQRGISEQALTAAGAKKNAKVIFLADKNWHAGVGGIVASDVKEKFNRPVIVCARQDDGKGGGFWKGSGRSIEEFNLGQAIQTAVKDEVIDGGGGHEMAGGLFFKEEQREKFERWVNETSGLDEKQFVRKVEIIAPAETFDAETWFGIYRALEPFGNGNPEPSLIASDVVLASVPLKLGKDRDESGDPSVKKAAARDVWAMRAVFEKNKKPISIESTDLAHAKKWKKRSRYNFDLVLTSWRRGKIQIYGFRVRSTNRNKKAAAGEKL